MTAWLLIKRVQIFISLELKKQTRPRGCIIQEWNQVYIHFQTFSLDQSECSGFWTFARKFSANLKSFLGQTLMFEQQDVSRCWWYYSKVCRNYCVKFGKNDFGTCLCSEDTSQTSLEKNDIPPAERRSIDVHFVCRPWETDWRDKNVLLFSLHCEKGLSKRFGRILPKFTFSYHRIS